MARKRELWQRQGVKDGVRTHLGCGAAFGVASGALALAKLLEADAGDCDRSITFGLSSSESHDSPECCLRTGVLKGSHLGNRAALDRALDRIMLRSRIFLLIFCVRDSLRREE